VCIENVEHNMPPRFAYTKIVIEVEIKREITALYFPAPDGQNFTQQLSVQNDDTKKNWGNIYGMARSVGRYRSRWV
jgi:hypothetical protein